jgi:hypothetical protein
MMHFTIRNFHSSAGDAAGRSAVCGSPGVAAKQVGGSAKDASALGPGLRAGLAVLYDAGNRIAERWSHLDAAAALELELSAAEIDAAQAGRFDESRPSVRWEAYGRTGLACAALRRAGREVRSTSGAARALGGRAAAGCGR